MQRVARRSGQLKHWGSAMTALRVRYLMASGLVALMLAGCGGGTKTVTQTVTTQVKGPR
jgi:hypothetical protein